VTDFLPADPPRLTSGRRDGAKRAR
jgi:hypothetical protein